MTTTKQHRPNTVYSYFEQFNLWDIPKRLMEQWRRSWEEAGWDAIMLTRRDAESHPDYERLLQVVGSFPTVNDRRYETACYVRWLAFDAAGGGLMSDYDVINNGFSLSDLAEDPKTPVFFDAARVPCLVQAKGAESKMIVDFLLNDTYNGTKHGGRPHYSDMIALQKTDWRVDRKCWEIGDEGWENAKAIHFATCPCSKWCPNTPRDVIVNRAIPRYL